MLLVVAGLVVLAVGLNVDRIFGSPVLVFPIGAALFMAVSYRFAYPHIGATRAHWLVVVLLSLCSLLPLLGVPSASGYPADLLVGGGAAIAVGMIDHLRLMSAMKVVPRD